MVNKYKMETWKKRYKREYPNAEIGFTKKGERFFFTFKKRLVKRDSNGRFSKGSPVITEIKEKTYGSGVYEVGIQNGRIVTRHLIEKRETPKWREQKKETLKNANMFRCSLALNDIPYKGTEYYGFRIIAFSRRKEALFKVYPKKMYDKLIEFIEKCLHYKNADFWFSHYLNYIGKIPPEISNSSRSDNGKYYLLWTKRKTGSTMKQDWGFIGAL